MKSHASFLRRVSVSASFALFAGCQFFTGPKITDEIVDKYVKAYTGLRQIGPELAEKMKNAQGREVDIDPGMQGYAQIEKIIKDAGFKDYKEFVQVNAKIGLAFSQISSTFALSLARHILKRLVKFRPDAAAAVTPVQFAPQPPVCSFTL